MNRVAALAFCALAARAVPGTELVVYTALETDHLKAYAESHRRANPDMILGVAASSMEVFKSEGMLVAYAPRGFGQLERRFSDLLEPPNWVGMDIFSALICYNPKASSPGRKAPKPTRWSDLDLELVSPRDGVGWDIEAAAILRPARKLAAAQRFMDWVASREANEVYARYYVIVAHPQVKDGRLPHIPADLGKRLSATDLEYAARNRSRILAEWTRRYGAKVQRQ